MSIIRAAPHIRSLAAAPNNSAGVLALRRFGLTTVPGSCQTITTNAAKVESCKLHF